MTGHDDLLAQADEAVAMRLLGSGLISDLAAALRAVQADKQIADELAIQHRRQLQAIKAAAQEVMEWWDDDYRGGDVEIEALRALLDVPAADTDTSTGASNLTVTIESSQVPGEWTINDQGYPEWVPAADTATPCEPIDTSAQPCHWHDVPGRKGYLAAGATCPAADTATQPHQWRATGGNGTATVVSRIGGPAFAVLRHGKPAIGLAEMVAAALNAAPWLTPPADVPAADTATQDQP